MSVNLDRLRRALAVVAIFVLAACGDEGDPTGTTETGSIRGSVTDGTGAAVADAGIQLTGNDQDARSATSGADGLYTFDDVEPGTYTLTVTPPAGFTIGAPATTTITVASETRADASPFVLAPVPVVDCSVARPDFGVAAAAERSLFAYNASAPLNLETTVEDTIGGVEVSAISYDSPDGGRVTGLLFDPIERSAPRPGIVIMYGPTAEYMRGNADLLARHGAVVIAIDAPGVRRGGEFLQFTPQDSVEQVQLMKDLQRAVDVLIAHPRVDAERIAFQGTGYGGTMGVLFAAIDERIQGAALIVPEAGMVSRYTGPGSSFLAGMPCAVRSAWLKAMTPIEPIRFVGHATPTPLLMQSGMTDPQVPQADASALHAAAPEPKEIHWYPAGRQLGEQAFLDRVEWLHDRIGLDVDAPEDDACPIGRPDFGVATVAERAVFAYDADAPLNLARTIQSTTNGVQLSVVSYDSPAGGKVTGFMFDPVGRPAGRPGIVLMHGMPSNAASMIPYATALAQYGAIVIAIDAPHARRVGPSVLMTVQDSVEQVQLMKDLQRAVDVLRADPRVDDDNIAYVGVSYGGAMGALFAGIEQRLATAVLVVGDGGLVTHSTHPGDFDSLTQMSCAERSAWFGAMVPIEPIRFVGLAAPTPLLFQNGYQDDLSLADDAAEMHAAASEPKTILWYDAGHNLTQQAVLDRHNWLSEHIGLDPL